MLRLSILAVLICAHLGFAQGGVAELEKAFRNPPGDARIMMRWWWFGPSVTKAGLEREMRAMKQGGIGGFEVQPVYPMALDDAKTGIRNLPYLSDGFIDALRFTSGKARELGLRMDLTLGSGWPFGGATVPVAESAGRLRCERVRFDAAPRRVPLPSIAGGEEFIAAFVAARKGGEIVPGSARRIEDIHDGALWLPAGLPAPGEVQFFVSSRTGQQVKRAAVGAEGFVVNHYDAGAVRNYLKAVGDRMMPAFDGHPPQAVFCDSLEVYGSDWTPALLAEFRSRRGYDLLPHLPALVADAGPETAGIRHDWAKTLTELLNERFIAPVAEWSKRNGTRFRAQIYGTPPATISSYAKVDLPEGEGPEWKTLRASRWASSAAHLFGRNITSSETWTWLHSPVFSATPLDIKAEADLHFLQGINQLIGHGWPYTAEGVEYPGWRFYAAAVFDDKNPWWIVMPDLTTYLQRMSFLMRQGNPANDVAFYLPNDDAWAAMSPGRVDLLRGLVARIGPDVVARVLEAGFNLDFFDDGVLAQLGRVENGALAMGANRYRIVVLPNVERMPVATLRKLEEFVRAGGTLVATRRIPSLAPGFQASEAEQREVKETAARLFAGPAKLVADENRGLAEALATRVRPDVSLSPAVPEIGFIHRSTPDAEIYFLANSANTRRSVKATFRVAGMRAESWDPFTGGATGTGTGSTLALDFEPYGSRVVVFSKRTLPVQAAKPEAAPPIDISTGWTVRFGERTVKMDTLRSWTEDEATRYYSGTAVYEKEVNIPEAMLKTGVRIDFGEGKPVEGAHRGPGMRAWFAAPVRDAAVVSVNGRRAGAVFCPPYAVDLTGFLHPGANRIRIEVANVAVNYMAGRKLPDYRLLNLRYGVRFEAQDMDKVQPAPSGLLGPVRLVSGTR